MSARLGMQIGYGLANMGNTLAGVFNEQNAKADEEATYTLAQQMMTNPDEVNYKDYSAKQQLKAMSLAADTEMKKFRASEAGRREEAQEMALSAQRLKELEKNYKASRSAGDEEAAKNFGKQYVFHARNGVAGFKEKGDGKVELRLLNGETREEEWDLDKVDKFVEAYGKNENVHFQNRVAEKTYIKENNLNAMMNPETWYNENGEEIVVQKGLTDPVTRIQFNLYSKTNPETGIVERISNEEVAKGGYKPPEVWGGKEKVARSQYNTKLAGTKQKAIGTPDLSQTVQTERGAMAPTIGGGQYAPVPEGQTPKQKPRILGTVADEQGQVRALAQEDPYSTDVTPVDTGVKKSGKKEDKVYPVKDPRTGETVQMGDKELRANLKEAKALLKTVKDDAGLSLVLPDLDDWETMSNKKKETILGKVVRLAADESQPPQVQDAAVRVLTYLEALGITQKSSTQPKAEGLDLKQFHPDNYTPLS